ncbi:MAG TPA: 2-oxo-tetronate isomerase [Sphingobium sp.]|nr:2-oxo-tetronate isomerase [Sphingobium sp.]
MPRLAANLSLMFTELPFLDRFAAAADAGFGAVEFMFPYDWDPGQIAARASAQHLDTVLFNCPAGDWAAGERGIAALPDRIAECRDGVARAVDYARALGCSKLHLLAGVVPPGADRAQMHDVFVDNVRYAADLVAGDGIEILLEPINRRVDIPGYLHGSTAETMAIIERVARPNVRLQYDVYHMQIVEGDLIRHIEALIDRIGHVQIADNPGRAEPGTGEINIHAILRRLDALGYAGHVGCEYRPAAGTVAGLGWAAPYLDRPGRQL